MCAELITPKENYKDCFGFILFNMSKRIDHSWDNPNHRDPPYQRAHDEHTYL
jgi:hypothetical protein